MKAISLMIAAAVFMALALAGSCADAIDIYTFKKDRVDQEINGNQGYLSGPPPAVPQDRVIPKRTLIGVDIELPGGSSSAESEPVKPAPAKEAPAPQPVKATKVEVKEKIAENEDEWIK